MALKVPPPPQLAAPDLQALNRWLIELQSILNGSGTINQEDVTGLPALQTQVNTNTTDIADLQGNVGGNTGAITTLQNDVTTINNEIVTINSTLTTLESNPVVRNGVGAPNAGLGNTNDWYSDTSGHHIYVKTASATWTLII